MMRGFGFLWMLVPALFLVGFIALVVWAITRMFPSGQQRTPADSRESSAEETLRQRYARGEIDEGEYESTRKVLREE